MRIAELLNATYSLLTEVSAQPNMAVMLYHLTPARNLPRILQQGLVPKIGVRARKTREPVPAIYLFPTIEDAEDALVGCMESEFSENTRMALLAVEVPAGATEIEGAGYERVLTSPIPP